MVGVSVSVCVSFSVSTGELNVLLTSRDVAMCMVHRTAIHAAGRVYSVSHFFIIIRITNFVRTSRRRNYA